jgi:hypothetical protein
VIPLGGDPNGLNVSIALQDATRGFAVSMASALSTDVRILQ